jgi:hypothetical protein
MELYLLQIAQSVVKKRGIFASGYFSTLTARHCEISTVLNCTEFVITYKQKGVFIGPFQPVPGLYNNKYKLTVLP